MTQRHAKGTRRGTQGYAEVRRDTQEHAGALIHLLHERINLTILDDDYVRSESAVHS